MNHVILIVWNVMKKQINFKKIAKTIVEKQISNLTKCITTGASPDLYWKLEYAIESELRKVSTITEKEVRNEIFDIIKDFDDKKEPQNN